MVRILYIGDVVGQPGRRALRQKLEHVVDREKIDFTIVNVENAAGGFGVTEAIIEELSDLPINAYTSGNHIWDKKEFVENYDRYDYVIRPANYPAGNPGKGRVVRQTAGGVKVGVLQLMGNVFMPPCDNPFHCADRELKELADLKVIVVDIHGEASSEKQGASGTISSSLHLQGAPGRPRCFDPDDRAPRARTAWSRPCCRRCRRPGPGTHSGR